MRITLLLLTAAATFSHAAQATTLADECKAHADLAGTIMEARQAGIPAADVAQVLERNGPAPTSRMALLLVAYDQNLASTPDEKSKLILEFKNAAFVRCMKTGEP